MSATVATGLAFTSNFSTFGSSTACGRSERMSEIFSRTSVAQTSVSRPSSNSSSTWQTLLRHVVVMCLMPSTCTTASSTFLATEDSISSGEAPG